MKINSSKDIFKKTQITNAIVAVSKKSGLYMLHLIEHKVNKNTLDLVLQDLGLTKDDLLKSFDLIRSNDEANVA